MIEIGGKKVSIFKNGEYEIVKIKPSLTGLKETWATGSLVRQTGSSGEFLDKYLANRKEKDGLSALYKVYGIGEDGLGYRYMSGPKKLSATKGKFYSGIPLKTLEDLKNGKVSKFKPIENFYDLSGNFGNCRHEGGVSFGGGKKPENLLKIIVEYFSSEGDLVLDSFGGSGTTSAVAHKLNRRWITVELKNQAFTHIQPRIRNVVDNKDDSGITEISNWKGGGGFKFYRLAPSLLNKDRFDNWVIAPEYNAQMLAAAVAKQEGFRYEPDADVYWKQARSSEKDYLFTTTQFLTVEMVDRIVTEMAEGESLLIACKAYQDACTRVSSQITIKKIPSMLYDRCEFGKDDYSLNIVNLPKDDEAPDLTEDNPDEDSPEAETPTQTSLF